MEVIKIILKHSDTLAGRLLLFDGLRSSFRNVRLRNKRDDCQICSAQPTITKLLDYEQFCGMRATDKDLCLDLLTSDQRITVTDYHRMLDDQKQHLLIDVRSENEFEICQLANSINVPIKEFQGEPIGHLANTLIASTAGKGCYFALSMRREGKCIMLSQI